MKNILLIIFAFFTGESTSDFEVCNPGVSQTVYQFLHDNCPFGVLFEHPISVDCLASTNFPEHYITDVCNPDSKPLNINEHPYKIHLALQMDPEPVDPDNSCVGIGSDKCDVYSVIPATNDTLTPLITPGCETGYEENPNLTPEEEARRKDRRVFIQTERLFKFILGLIDDRGKDGGPDLRLIKLLKWCFRIFKKFTSVKFIRPEFANDVLKAFVYLFRDSDLTNFKDISVDDFRIIEKTLKLCESMAPPFRLIGRSCRTCSHVYSIEKRGKTIRYTEDEFAFVWGKYDIPIDATWNIVTFAHGLCYGTYKLHVNYHHLYEQEMERLFTPEILYRWNRPPQLYYEELWDHIFSTTVKDAMKNLDVSIFGAYHDTPFLHRLERPIQVTNTMPLKNGNRRKKRSILPTMSLDDGGLEGAGWCFQTSDELVGTVSAYMNYHCPDVPLLEELKSIKTLEVTGNDDSTSDEFMNEQMFAKSN